MLFFSKESIPYPFLVSYFKYICSNTQIKLNIMKHKHKPVPGGGRMYFPYYLIFILLQFPFCLSCSDSDSPNEQFDPNKPVEVSSIVPESAAIGLPLIIHGNNFGTDKSKIKVLFDDVEAKIIKAKNEHLYVLNPKQSNGEHTIKVIVGDKEGAMAKKFNYVVTASVTTVAGNGERGTSDGNSLEAEFVGPDYIAVDDKGNILASDWNGDRIRLISLEESKVTTLSKNDNAYGVCYSADYNTAYIAVESSSKLSYEYDCSSNWLRSVIENTVEIKDGAASLAIDKEGNIYYIGYRGAIARKDHLTKKVTIIGEIPNTLIDTKADGYGVDSYACYNSRDNNIYVSTKYDHAIIRFEAKSKLESKDFELYAGRVGNSGLGNGHRLEATFKGPRGMAFDSKGNMYIADSSNHVIRMIDTDGNVSTFIGNPIGGNQDGLIEDALFLLPYDITINPDDIMYVADSGNHRIRCISIQ